MKYFILINVLSIIFFVNLFAQVENQKIVINVTQNKNASPSSRLPQEFYINGYRGSVDGQSIEYHSVHPDANQALLVRAKRDVHSITWETDTLPNIEGNFYNLIWLAGIEKSGWQQTKAHRFDLSINGKHWFTFYNLKDSTAFHWRIPGEAGSELSFTSTMADRFGDLFGYMNLKLPKSEFKPSSPLSIKVEGEDADSPDWYMTFEYHFNFKPKLRLEPALLKSKSNPTQMVRLSLDNLQNGNMIEINIPSNETMRETLKVGANIFYIPIKKVNNEQIIQTIFKVDGKIGDEINTTIKQVVRRDIYLLSYSHNDIGYTDLQPNVERKQMKNIDDAIDLIETTKDYPPDSRYKWNLEVIWALESYMKQASEEKRMNVVAAIKNGSIGLNALYANVLTGLANTVEMNHFTDYARKFSKEYSFPITTACVSDIPGFTWGLVSTLAQSGVKYFSSAPNNSDRVGNIYNLGDKPFYWVSQSGEEKVLMWLAAASYSSFHEGDLTKLGDEKILKMLRNMDENNYPYEIVQLPYTVGGDNGIPDTNLSDFVRQWNEKYETPHLIIATHEQMFKDFEKQYGSTLPTLKGDITPYWEDGAASSAYETALNRKAVDRLIQSEAILSMKAPDTYPGKEYHDAWRDVVLWDEHTWGANVSVSDPDSQFVKDQWKIKRQFVLDADSISRLCLNHVLMKSANTNNSIDVYNTNSWRRSDVVIVPKEQSAVGDLVVDEKGNKIISQRLSTGELAFMVSDILPYSIKKYTLKKGKAYSKGSVKILGTTIENQLVSATVDGNTGMIDEFVWKQTGGEFAHSSNGLNQYLYIPGKNSDSVEILRQVKIKIKEHGPLVASLLIEADAPGCKNFSTEYMVYSDIDRMDIINHIDKTAIRDKESVHIGFPFNLSNGILRYDVANSIVQPEIDQLLGSCKNFFSVQSFVDVSDNFSGITLAIPDAPLVEMGAINTEKPWIKTIKQSQTFYSYVMNNYWHTNYKADQEGPVTFRYSIKPHALFKYEDALKFGIEQRQPLIVAPSSAKSISPMCTLEPQSVIMNSIKPLPNSGGWLAEIYNASSEPQYAAIQWNKSIPVDIFLSTIDGVVGDKIKSSIEIPAYGTRFILIERKK